MSSLLLWSMIMKLGAEVGIDLVKVELQAKGLQGAYQVLGVNWEKLISVETS